MSIAQAARNIRDRFKDDANVVGVMPFGGKFIILFVKALDPALPSTTEGFDVKQKLAGVF